MGFPTFQFHLFLEKLIVYFKINKKSFPLISTYQVKYKKPQYVSYCETGNILGKILLKKYNFFSNSHQDESQKGRKQTQKKTK